MPGITTNPALDGGSPSLSLSVATAEDVVVARQQARLWAESLGFDRQNQVRIATAVSEIARHGADLTLPTQIQFSVSQSPPTEFRIEVCNPRSSPKEIQNVLDGIAPPSEAARSLVAAQRLMDRFDVNPAPEGGVQISLGKRLPPRTAPHLDGLLRQFASQNAAKPAVPNPLKEFHQQNRDLLDTFADLDRSRVAAQQLSRELEDTNRGVVALYAELDEKAKFLREASDLKSRFLSNMTHEFRTPLNSILSLSRMLLDRLDGDLTPEQEKQVRFIKKAASDLSVLVNDLLDLAKVEAGKVILNPTEFKVSDLFGALRGLMRPLLGDFPEVTLAFDEPAGFPTLHTDEAKLGQILRNLISNALKFTQTGSIRVGASLDDDEHVTFFVADTGIGIRPEDQERIFEEFVQLDGPYQNRVRGTGLGLPISRKLAELLGGSLSVSSTPGVGSTFTVRLPIAFPACLGASYFPGTLRDPDPLRIPVLVVGHSISALSICEKALQGTEFQVVPERTPQEAGAALERIRPAAILLNIDPDDRSWSGFVNKIQSRDRDGIPSMLVTPPDQPFSSGSSSHENVRLARPASRDALLPALRSLAPKSADDLLLIVDDDETSRYVLRDLLQETRFHVEEVSGGNDAIAFVRHRPPVCLFLDIVMPDMDGFEVFRRLQADPALREIPVVIHTERALSSATRADFETRALGILSKDHSHRESSVRSIRELLFKAEARRSGRPA